MYLPDTNIFILGILGEEPEATFLYKVIKKGKLVISSLVIAEYLSKANKKEENRFKMLIGNFKVLSVDAQVAEAGAKYRQNLRQKSKRVALIDCLIAAQAKLDDLTLVTNNRSDFPMSDIKVIKPLI